MSDKEFDALIARAMDELPKEYIDNLENVAIVMQDQPTAEQVEKMKIDRNHLLLGLYEGVPKTQQGNGWTGLLPSKITLFKEPILRVAGDDSTRQFEQIKRTLWHEIAHYYGLNHGDIDRISA